MSMGIDLSKPLDDKSRAYLAMRGRYADISRLDGQQGVDSPELPEGDGTGPDVIPLMTAEQRSTERERLMKRLAEIDGAEPDAEEGDDEVDPYEVWNTKELDAELKRRDLPGGGTKSEKASRLEEDDVKANEA